MIVGIIGLGLIGGSLAKAFCRSKDVTVLGWDANRTILQFAQLAEAIQGELTDENLKEVDLLLLATYPEAVIEHMQKLAPKLSKHTMVIDCAGTKEKVCNAVFPLAEQYGFRFLGGHPMAGTHNSGFKYARSNLYHGAPMVIVPADFDDITLLGRVKDLLAPAGFGRLSVTTAEKHDEMIAFTSQLPHVLACSYISDPLALSHKGFSAGSFLDVTRVAFINDVMWSELFIDNADHLCDEIDELPSEY